MAKTWNKGEWEDELIRIATAAADDYVSKLINNTEGYSERMIEAIRKESIRTGVAELKKNFGFSLSDKDKNTVSNWDVKDASSYLFSGGNKLAKDSHNPILKKRMDDFAKLSPLVQGIADEGRDWYSMGAVDLLDTGKKLGYNTKSKEGRMDFLRDVGDVQTAYDRGKLLEEFDKKGATLFYDLVLPTVAEEARKQIATGRGEKGDLWKAYALDAATNTLMGNAPSVSRVGRFAKHPVIGATAGATLQGFLEGGRQGVKTLIDDELEADLTLPLLTTTLGATRPGMIGTFAGLTQQIPTGPAGRFAAGLSAATRGGNPTYRERDEFAEALDMLIRHQKRQTPNRPALKASSEPLREGNLATEQAKTILGGDTAAAYTLPEIAAAERYKKVLSQLTALYGGKEATNLLNRVIDKEQVLLDYDNLANLLLNRARDDASKKLLSDWEMVNGVLREGNILDNLGRAFPSKMAEAYGKDKVYKAGLMFGNILGDIGGRVEPVLKVNPFGSLSGGGWNIGGTDYKETPWYKRMTKRLRDALDYAYEEQKKQKKQSE